MFKSIIFSLIHESQYPRLLGAYRIAHFLRENDWDVEVVDFTNFFSLSELKELFLSRYDENLKFVGISHTFAAEHPAWDYKIEEFFSWIKKSYPEIKIISGSSGMSLFKTEIIDYYLEGFGENAILKLLKYLFSNGEQPIIERGALKHQSVIRANKHYPAYPLKSLMVKYEDRDFILSEEWLGIETSRGCIFSCDYCNFPILGVKGDYTREAEDFKLQILDAYERFGVKNYVIADETFNDKPSKIKKFADAVENLSFKPFFSGYIRPDLVINRPRDKEDLLRMGFLGHYYGVETFKQETAISVGKGGISREKLKDGLLDIKEYFLKNSNNFYRGEISYILGLPGETIEDLDNTKKWITENWYGQAFTYFILSIYQKKLATLSKMDKNYEKYGYSLVDEEAINKNRDIFDDKRIFTNLDLKTQLLWKNEHMNIFDAKRIEMQWDDYFWERKISRLGCFILGFPSENHDLNSRLKLITFPDRSTFVKNYISKKLNYIKKEK
jgi:radical SAM superfamily enzyme YgiQ (UPF0313 family)